MFKLSNSIVHVSTDGACKNNQSAFGSAEPRAGWGVAFHRGGEKDERNCYGRVVGKQTNNRAELTAIQKALELFSKSIDTYLTIHTDSQYCIGTLTGKNKVKANKDIIGEIKALMAKCGRNGKLIKFEHVKGHSGDPMNELADSYAVKGALLEFGVVNPNLKRDPTNSPLLVDLTEKKNSPLDPNSILFALSGKKQPAHVGQTGQTNQHGKSLEWERIDWDSLFMGFAVMVAKRSTCLRLQTGSVMVKDTRVVSIGFNGVCTGKQHCCDYWAEETKMEKHDLLIYAGSAEFAKRHREWSNVNELHAECNCILYADRDKARGSTLYTVWSPCIMCAKIIVTAGVARVVYREDYRDQTGLKFLSESGVETEKFLA
jgi:dCMP deaminase